MTQEHWAKPISSLHIAHDLPPDAVNLNVEGKRLAGLTGGFGKMWQKTYRVSLGSEPSPEDVVREWKQHFGEFWPKGARFFGAPAGVRPGDVALLNVKKTGAPTVAIGVLVLYADDVSFSFISPEGHMFVGMITFSAHRSGAETIAQIQLFIRAGDPLYELMMGLGGHRLEDKQWTHVLRQVAAHFGVDAEPQVTRVLIDRRRQWRHARNITKNAAIHSTLHAFRLKRARS